MARLQAGDVAGWLLKSTRPPAEIDPGWAPGEQRELTRCVRRSYRLDLLVPGAPVVLWVSGRVLPGIHAVGTVTGPVRPGGGDDAGPGDDRPALPVRLTRLAAPVERGELLHDRGFRDAEVLRMPAGSNPSWLSGAQLAVVLERAGHPVLGRWTA